MTGTRVRPRDTADGDELLAAIYQRVERSVGTVPQMYRALANSPKILDGWIRLGWSLRSAVNADRGLCELAILRVAQLSGSEYVWRSHWDLALQAGVVEDKLRQLGSWRDSDLYSATERAVLAAADVLTEAGSLPDETWSPLAARLDDAQAVELVMTIAWYCCVVRVAAGLAVPPEPSHDGVPGLRTQS